METNNSDVVPVGEILFEEPFNELLPKFQALTEAEVEVVNLDIAAAVTTVLGVQPRVVALEDQMAKELPAFDREVCSKLSVYALGLSHAHTLYMMASAPQDSLQPLADEGAALHDTLLKDANALVQRKLIDGKQLRDLKGVVGYKNIAFDLQILAQTFRNAGESIAGKCATQPAEVLRAEQIAAMLLQAIGIKEQGAATVAAWVDMRNRAFTLFVNAYDQVRRAVGYLRWNQEDADAVAPSLYAGRGNGRNKPDAPVPPAPEPPAPAPSPVPPTQASESTNGASKTGPGAQPFLTGS